MYILFQAKKVYFFNDFSFSYNNNNNNSNNPVLTCTVRLIKVKTLKCPYYAIFKVDNIVLGVSYTGLHASKVKKHFSFLKKNRFNFT